jgi:predicted  nucleic acid-binding Zn-ribbon protein
MDTKEQLLILLEICRQDQKIFQNKEKLAKLNVENKQAIDAATTLQGILNEVSGRKAELLKQRKVLDEKLQTEKANLRKWEARAEKIKGEREYTALMSEIGAQKRTITGLEIQINEVTDELKSSEEKLKKTTTAHEEKQESAERAFQSVKELLGDEQELLEKNQIARAALLDKIPPSLKLKYERIYEKRSQQGVAFLKDSICQSCMRMVPQELYIRVAKGEVIEQCPSCQRILVAQVFLT